MHAHLCFLSSSRRIVTLTIPLTFVSSSLVDCTAKGGEGGIGHGHGGESGGYGGRGCSGSCSGGRSCAPCA